MLPRKVAGIGPAISNAAARMSGTAARRIAFEKTGQDRGPILCQRGRVAIDAGSVSKSILLYPG